jgi:hypothetical protein
MLRLRRGRRAVAGFFEEIPAAVVVITAFLLFMSAMIGGLRTYNQELGASNFAFQANSFLEELEGYKNLTYLNQQGVFEAAKVTTLTVSNITYDFHPPFNYNVTIIDLSNYTVKYNMSLATSSFPTTSASLKVGMVRESTTVSIWVPELTFDEFHAALLTVTIWE